MAEYVQLGAMKTWYDGHGSSDPLVLLHGGLVDARSFDPNLGALAERFHVYTPERHGHTPDVPVPITEGAHEMPTIEASGVTSRATI